MASFAKAAQTLARRLLQLSLVDGVVSAERVGGVLAYIAKHSPRQPVAVLRAYHHLVARELAKGVALVEHAGEVTPEILSAIEGAMAQKYKRPISSSTRRNDVLLAGLRVRVADDVFEASVAGKLAALAASV